MLLTILCSTYNDNIKLNKNKKYLELQSLYFLNIKGKRFDLYTSSGLMFLSIKYLLN